MAKLGFAFGAVVFVMVLLQKGNGTEFIVGGAKGWSVSVAQSYNQWAEANRFQIGDSLVFNYGAEQDSVLQVTQDDYANCSIQSPLKQHSDGHTVVQFDKSGPHYFISGNKNNCLKNEKLVVVVLADRTISSSNHTISLPPTSAPSPSPTSSTEIAPSPAPANDQTGAPTPSPSGSTEINPSPPPAEEVNPSPPPTGEETPSPPAGAVEINPAPPVSRQPTSFGISTIPGSIASTGMFAAAVILAF